MTKAAMIAKYMRENPGTSEDEAYELWKADMRKIAKKGGSRGVGHKFAHGKADPKKVGQIGRKNRWKKS